MPKIVSRNVISQSKEELQETDPSKILTIQYCLCGEFLLVMPGGLDNLARRPLDGALVLRNTSTGGEGKDEGKVYKLNAVGGVGTEAKGILIKRPNNTYEYQNRLHCPRCSLVIGYETLQGPIGTKGIKGSATFLLPGAMTDVQNKIPENAFGEINVMQEEEGEGERK